MEKPREIHSIFTARPLFAHRPRSVSWRTQRVAVGFGTLEASGTASIWAFLEGGRESEHLDPGDSVTRCLRV